MENSIQTSNLTPAVNIKNSISYNDRPWKKNLPSGVSLDLPPLPYNNIAQLCLDSAEKYGHRQAFTICLPNGFSHTLTYSQVDELSDRFAAYLSSVLKLERGSKVAVQMPNCLAFPIVCFGIFKAGCVLVNVNPLYTKVEMIHQFNDSKSETLVIIDMFTDKLDGLSQQTSIKNIITCSLADQFPLLLGTLIKTKLRLTKQVKKCLVSHTELSDAIHMGRRYPIPKLGFDLNLQDLAVLQYTGGTTGISKGAMLSHGNILSNVAQIQNVSHQLLLTKTEVMLTALPCHHIFAFTVNFLTVYANGCHNILVPSPRPITNLKKVFQKFPITWITGVNTLYNSLADEDWFRNDPPKLKAAIAGGTALLNAVATKWTKVTNSPIFEGFGLTETSPVLTINPIGVGGGKNRTDFVGLPLPGTLLRCVDENGLDVELGQPGELIAKAPQVMLGYFNRPDETAKSIKDGWFYTGDIAIMDKEGYFKIVDRKKDMILVSGFNVYPNEIEDVLARHPDVKEVSVIGVPDNNSGEAVKAFIVLKDGKKTNAEILREYCKESLTSYKIPKQFEFRDELPKSNVGKILRKDLRAEQKSS